MAPKFVRNLILFVIVSVACLSTDAWASTRLIKNVKFLKALGLSDQIISIADSPRDPFTVVTCNRHRAISAYDVRSGSRLWSFQSRFINETVGLEIDEDGRTLAVSGAHDGRTYVDFFDLKTGITIKQIVKDVEPVPGPDGVTEQYGWFDLFNPVIEFASAHRLYVVQTAYATSNHDALINLYDSEKDREIFSWSAAGGTVFTQFKFSGDGRLVYGAHRTGYEIWNTQSGKKLNSHKFDAVQQDPNERSTIGAFSPDGRIVAFAFANAVTNRSTLRVFEAERVKQICEIQTSAQSTVKFSKSGSQILVVNKDGTFMEVSAVNCELLASGELGIWNGPEWNIPLNFLEISEDGEYLYSPYNPTTGKMDDLYVYALSNG